MTIAEPPTLDQVLTLAQRLPAADKLRLIARLAPELVATLPPQGEIDSWDEFVRFSAELEPLAPLADDSATVLSSMRR
jgi:hypothetical protein